jgi:hypothetical protein
LCAVEIAPFATQKNAPGSLRGLDRGIGWIGRGGRFAKNRRYRDAASDQGIVMAAPLAS